MADVEFWLYAENNTTSVGQITPATHGIGLSGALPSFQRVGHDAGSATFTLPADSAILPSLGQVLRVKLNGSDWGAWRITAVRPTVVSPEEDAGLVWEFTGRELLVDDERAVIQRNVLVGTLPAFDDRVEGWMSPTYSESGSWVAATAVAVQGWGSAFYTGLPSGWSDPAALWISDGSGDHTDAPDDTTRRWRRSVSLAAPIGNGVLQVAVDNSGTFWWNGHELGDWGDFQEARQFELGPLTAGTHVLAGVWHNNPDDGPPGGNPTAVIWTLRDGIGGAVLARSDTSTHVLPYTVSAPTTTEGAVLLNLFDDSPNLASRSCTFTASVDSDSATWPAVERFKLGVGGTVAGWLRDRAASTLDWEHHPDGSFSAWAKGGRGSTSTVDLIAADSTAGQLAPSSVNLNALEWDSDAADGFDALLVRHDDGYLVRPASPAADATYGFLRVDGSASEATTVADDLLAAYGAGLSTATIEFVPTSLADWPGTGFDVWDVLNVPTAEDLDATTAQRVRAITLRLDDNGDPSFIIELGSLWQERVELLERRARSDGATGLELPQPVPTVAATVAPPRVANVVIASSTYPSTDDVVKESGIFCFPYTCRLLWLRCTAKTPGGTTTLKVRRNGTNFATLSMGSGDTSDFDDSPDTTTTPADQWDCIFTAAGDHTNVTVTAGVAPVGT